MPFNDDSFVSIIRKSQTEHFRLIYKRSYFIAHMSFYVLNCAIFFAAAYLSPSNILNNHPRRVQWAFGLQFIIVTIRMQYTHVTLERFNPFRRTVLITWSLLIAQIYFSLVNKQSFMNEANLYLIICIYSTLSLLHMAYFVIDELKNILNVNCFIITRPRKPLEEVH